MVSVVLLLFMADQDCLFAPSPWDYAAVQIDPVAMVLHLNDALALEAARRMNPKTYLVHLSWVSARPAIFEFQYSLQ